MSIRAGGGHRPGSHVRDGRPAALGSPLVSSDLRAAVERAVLDAGLIPSAGVLFWAAGPAYETAAEARAARALGADAANMSCLPELHAAAASGIRAACLSRITNHTANCSVRRTDHEEIVRKGIHAVASLERIVTILAGRIG
jgi:purine nucleoside phosphorylase